MWQWFGQGLVAAGACVLAMSFAGDLHGLGDSLAVFRPLVLAGCLLVSAVVWRWRGAQALAAVVVLVAGWHVVSGRIYTVPDGPGEITMYQKNMLYRQRDRTAFEADLREMNADFVTLQEVSRANLSLLAAVKDLYPHQLICDGQSVGGVTILSQTPFTAQNCGREVGMVRVVTQVRGRDVQVISVHQTWPWPFDQAELAQRLIADLAPLDNGVTVIGGDFNMVASGRSIAWFASATDTQRIGRHVRTYDLYGYPLGIDHILVTGGVGDLSVRPQFGSDHYGLFGAISFP